MIAKGKVHKFGDNVDTDVIIPARYLRHRFQENLPVSFRNARPLPQASGERRQHGQGGTLL